MCIPTNMHTHKCVLGMKEYFFEFCEILGEMSVLHASLDVPEGTNRSFFLIEDKCDFILFYLFFLWCWGSRPGF